MIQFIALRTCSSSNGGWVMFMAKIQVRLAGFDFSRFFRSEVVSYCWTVAAGGGVMVQSTAPDLMRL